MAEKNNSEFTLEELKNDLSVEAASTESDASSVHARQTQILDPLIGSLSDEIFAEEAAKKTDAELESENYRRLRRYEKDGEILWGTVYGVETFKGHVIFCVLWNGIKIIIPDNLYFEPTFDFGKNYPRLEPSEQLRIRRILARYRIGGKICFKVENAQRDIIEKGQFEGERSIAAVGNRVSAMATLRDIYFIHENRKAGGPAPRSIREGDIIWGNVLAVKEDSAEIECAGVETRLGKHNLLDNNIVTNCCDHVYVGDRIKVKVKSVFVNEDGTVHLGITGRINEVSKAIRTIRIGGAYNGKVIKYNKEKDSYTVCLSNGVLAAVPQANAMHGVFFNQGDTVQVYVTNKYESFVAGSAMLVRRAF